MVATALAVVPSVSGNTVASSTLVFEGPLTDNLDGTFSGTIMAAQDFDVYAKVGSIVNSDDSSIDGQPVGADHDPYPLWYPDVPDAALGGPGDQSYDGEYYALHLNGDTWEVWYLATEGDPTSGPGNYNGDPYNPIYGCMDWQNMYAVEYDQNWEQQWSGKYEDIKLQYPGFDVQINDIGNGNYQVILTPGFGDQPQDSEESEDINTAVTIAGGGTGDNVGGWEFPIIKAKWEVTNNNQQDDDPSTDGTQVIPNVGGKKTIQFYAAILSGSANIHDTNVGSVYAYVYHPDCSYKYKVPMDLVSKNTGQNRWANVITNNPSVVKYADGYNESEVTEEISQYLSCKIYYGEAEIDYCQPAGYYKVGVRAFDGYDWCEALWNQFWYVPTAAIALDFDAVNYGSAVTVGSDRWAEGDLAWDGEGGSGVPTVRNYGNVPVDLSLLQDDMHFSKDSSGAWNVEYDARLGALGTTYRYDPFCEKSVWPSGGTAEDANYFGTLDLCTQEKIDFSIHIKEAEPSEQYTGTMKIFAVQIDNPPYETPSINQITTESLMQTKPVGAPEPPCCTDPIV